MYSPKAYSEQVIPYKGIIKRLIGNGAFPTRK